MVRQGSCTETGHSIAEAEMKHGDCLGMESHFYIKQKIYWWLQTNKDESNKLSEKYETESCTHQANF